MSDVMDFLGDLVHHPIDTLTGNTNPPTPPNKPGYSAVDASHHLGSGLASKGASLVGGRQAALDKAVQDAGG